MKMTSTSTLFTLISLLCAGSLGATTLDYRHEYLDDTEQHADRARVSHRFDNQLGFAVEAKWGSKASSGESNLFESNYAKGHEFELNYQYKVGQKLTLSPAFVLDSSSSSTTYKAQLKGTYQLTDKLYGAVRYRYGLQNYTSVSTGDRHFNQGNFQLGYQFGWGKVEYDFEYKDTNYPSLRGKDNTYLHNLVVQVPVNKEWVPYVELGYVPYRNDAKGGYESGSVKYDNDFQVRYRMGIKYNF